MLDPIAVANVVNSNGSIGVEGVGGCGLLTVSFEVVGDDCLFVPSTQVLGNIDVVDGLGWISRKVGDVLRFKVGQLPGK